MSWPEGLYDWASYETGVWICIGPGVTSAGGAPAGLHFPPLSPWYEAYGPDYLIGNISAGPGLYEFEVNGIPCRWWIHTPEGYVAILGIEPTCYGGTWGASHKPFEPAWKIGYPVDDHRQYGTVTSGAEYPPYTFTLLPPLQSQIEAVNAAGLISGYPDGITLGSDGSLHGIPTELKPNHWVNVEIHDEACRASLVSWTLDQFPPEGGGSNLPLGDILVLYGSTSAETFLRLDCNNPPNGAPGVAYSHTLVTTGGSGEAFHYDLVGGALPPGLDLNSDTSAITGTPTTTGVYTFRIKVNDGTAMAGWSVFPIAPISVGARFGYVSNAWPEQCFNAMGARWAVLGKPDNGDRQFAIYRSTDGGRNWTEQDAANAPSGNRLAAWFDGIDTIYLAVDSPTGGSNFGVYDFSIANAKYRALGPFTPTPNPQGSSGIFYIVRLANGLIRLIYNDDMTLVCRDLGPGGWAYPNVVYTSIAAVSLEQIIFNGSSAHLFLTDPARRYTCLDASGTASAPAQVSVGSLGGSASDGSAGEAEIDVAAISGSGVGAFRGTPPGGPTWTFDSAYAGTAPSSPTLIGTGDGASDLLWVDQHTGYSTSSAIWFAQQIAGVWQSVEEVYTLAKWPFSKPALTTDTISRLALVPASFAIAFDGGSTNLPEGVAAFQIVRRAASQVMCSITIATPQQGEGSITYVY